jgi:predicted Zn-dependent protease
VLLAQVYLAQGKYKLAAAELEQAVAHDFCVRNSAHFNAVLAKVHVQSGEPEEAVKARAALLWAVSRTLFDVEDLSVVLSDLEVKLVRSLDTTARSWPTCMCS